MLSALNRYVLRSHISEAKFRQIVRLFALDLEATKVAALTHISRRTVNRFFHAFRIRLARDCEAHAPVRGTVEVDESYFGRRRIPGKRGRGAGGKTIVFGIFKRNGWVYTQIVPRRNRRLCGPLFAGASPCPASFTPTGGLGTTGWSTWATANTFGSNIATTCLSAAAASTSMALKVSGAPPKRGSRNAAAFAASTSSCTSRNANSGSTIDAETSSKRSWTCCGMTR